MNVDHKILAKLLANRIKTVLPSLIGNQQTGYMQGKFIGMNVRRLMDLLHYVDNENINAVLISVDLEKCFDTIEFESIRKTLQYYNFGEYFIQMIFTLYAEFQTSVLHNRYITKAFTPKRAIHQGCAVSRYLLILMAEILAQRIKSNPRVKGIPIGEYTEDVSQYIDDMTISSLFEQDSIEAIVEDLEIFYKTLDLKQTTKKTTIFCIGALKGSNLKLQLSKNFKWSDTDINILGIVLDEDDVHGTYSKLIEKMESVTRLWRGRGLTMKGKITVINSLVASLLVYHMQMLPTIDKNIEIKINRVIERFIWNGRKPKLHTNILNKAVADGGMNLFDPVCRDISLKVAWVSRLNLMDDAARALALYAMKPVFLNQEFWYLNIKMDDVGIICNPNKFWKSVITVWCKVNYHDVESIEQLCRERILYNSHIRLANKPFCIRKLANKGVYEILDIYCSNENQFYTHKEICKHFHVNINYLDYLSLITRNT